MGEPDRRQFLTTAATAVGAAAWPLAGCMGRGADTAHITGGFTGINVERGHQWRDNMVRGGAHDTAHTATPAPTTSLAPSVTHRTQVVIAGGGVAGLAAARALRLRGVDDFALLELEDSAGGNSRAGQIAGMACPQGAHYLPVPSDDAPEVQDLLEELGLRQRVAGRWVYDERALCHSPQERLWLGGAWQDGLLPVRDVGASTLAQYQRFSTLIEQAHQAARWTIPVRKVPPAPMQRALSAITFIAWLDAQGLTDPHLRWYLDYCCRDEYGAGIGTVSAWAGVHYFASRHGFDAPGHAHSAPSAASDTQAQGLLTWPEGNAWLTRRLTAPLGERLRTGCVVLRVAATKHGVEVDALNTATHAVERWQAQQAIVALPIFIAARVVQAAPAFLTAAAQRMAYAPWLVANLHIDRPLHDRPGPAPSWDNVLYGRAGDAMGLGYVDAMHQSLRPVPGPTVLTHYRALGDVAGSPQAGRAQLLQTPWAQWRDTIVAELSTAHPDLAAKVRHIDITRYGHAMAIPVPQPDGQIGHWPPQNKHKQLSKTEQMALRDGRMAYAHSDWAGYSVFEEAFTMGHGAGHLMGDAKRGV
jgi:Flavin containing amine oxidoreductase